MILRVGYCLMRDKTLTAGFCFVTYIRSQPMLCDLHFYLRLAGLVGERPGKAVPREIESLKNHAKTAFAATPSVMRIGRPLSSI